MGLSFSIGARPVFVDTHAAVRPIVTPLLIGVLRRPLESANYTSREFADTIARLGLRQSVGRTGICYDNAMAESFFAALKNERVHRTAYPTREHARRDVTRYIELWYNRRRLHSGLGYITPQEALNAWEQSQLAA
jgi:putative transposase